jgi:hypothetical protein
MITLLAELVRHHWIVKGLLTEPHIDLVDGGRWARKQVVCTRCGTSRRVWIRAMPETYGCPLWFGGSRKAIDAEVTN